MDKAPEDPDDRAWLLELIGRLDRIPHDDVTGTADNHRLSAAMCVAFADACAREHPAAATRLQATAAAARDHLECPDATTWAALFRAATASYGYGPGDGCHSVAELGQGCGPGTGCRTGIGWLWSLSHTVGASAVRRALEPLLRAPSSASDR